MICKSTLLNIILTALTSLAYITTKTLMLTGIIASFVLYGFAIASTTLSIADADTLCQHPYPFSFAVHAAVPLEPSRDSQLSSVHGL